MIPCWLPKPIWLAALSLSFAGGFQARAEDLKLTARLIWGTNDDKPPDKKHLPVDEATAKKLSSVFKWKHYYTINTVATNVPSRASRRVQMSDACSIEITELPGEKVEVSLFGEGKKVNKTTETLSKGTCFTLGGPVKNGTAWFIVVNQF